MARFYPLFSSSKGNSYFIGDSRGGILVDAGASYRRLCMAFQKNDLMIQAVKAVFITHIHSDHVKGLKMLTKNLGIPVFGQERTLSELLKSDMIHPSSEVYALDGPAAACDMEISCFNTPHDTAASCGYRIKTSDGRLCAVCTDLGHVTPEVDESILGCDLVLLEANYDEKMLREGPYPYYLKERIRSGRGHLSNNDSALQAGKLIRSGTTHIILGHLSQENNTPYIADKTVSEGLSEFTRGRDYVLEVAPVETSGKVVVF